MQITYITYIKLPVILKSSVLFSLKKKKEKKKTQHTEKALLISWS